MARQDADCERLNYVFLRNLDLSHRLLRRGKGLQVRSASFEAGDPALVDFRAGGNLFIGRPLRSQFEHGTDCKAVA